MSERSLEKDYFALNYQKNTYNRVLRKNQFKKNTLHKVLIL
jgi:hypothetical protein